MKGNYFIVSFEVLTTMLLSKIQVFWNVMPFRLLKWQSQCNVWGLESLLDFFVTTSVFSVLVVWNILKVEVCIDFMLIHRVYLTQYAW